MEDQKGLHDFTVEENGHKMRVIIPKSDDKSYDNYLIEAETEKTRGELKRKPAPQSIKAEKRGDLVQAIKEMQVYRERRKASVNRRFY